MEQQKELNRTYFRISLMFLAWGFMIALRAMIVIPDEPAPLVYEYHRPEKKIEKKVHQRDTLYLISSDWMFPYNFQIYNFPYYGCGGVVYSDMYPGYGYPSWGNYPLGGVVILPGADSTSTDSLFNTSNDSNAVNQMAQGNMNASQKKGIGKRFLDKLSQVKNNRKIRKERRSERRKN
jgi:hypothetical protein